MKGTRVDESPKPQNSTGTFDRYVVGAKPARANLHARHAGFNETQIRFVRFVGLELFTSCACVQPNGSLGEQVHRCRVPACVAGVRFFSASFSPVPTTTYFVNVEQPHACSEPWTFSASRRKAIRHIWVTRSADRDLNDGQTGSQTLE